MHLQRVILPDNLPFGKTFKKKNTDEDKQSFILAYLDRMVG